MTTEQQETLRVVPAPSINAVEYGISHVFKTLIRANLPPMEAPERSDYKKIAIPMEHYGHLSCGTMDGQIEVVGYALDRGTVIFMNVICTTRSAQEVFKATLALGSDMHLIKHGKNWGNPLYVPRDEDGKVKYAYQCHDFSLPILKARQTVAMIRSLGDSSWSKLGRYIPETSLADAQWALLGIITEVTGLPVRPEWAQLLWYIGVKGNFVRECDGAPLKFWRVDGTGETWRTVIQLCISLGYIDIQ